MALLSLPQGSETQVTLKFYRGHLKLSSKVFILSTRVALLHSLFPEYTITI